MFWVNNVNPDIKNYKLVLDKVSGGRVNIMNTDINNVQESKEERMRSALMFAIAICMALVMIGCGAMFQGSTQTIDIQSSPNGAKVKGSPEIGDYTTPTSVRLSRKHSYTFTFSKEGYKPATAHVRASAKFGYIFLDVFFTGLVGVVVDAATGSWNGLKPETVFATLEKEKMGVIGPNQIEIQMSLINDGFKIVSDGGEPVQVHIEVSK